MQSLYALIYNVLILAVKVCNSCHQVEALWQCDECQSNFCNLCYDKVSISCIFFSIIWISSLCILCCYLWIYMALCCTDSLSIKIFFYYSLCKFRYFWLIFLFFFLKIYFYTFFKNSNLLGKKKFQNLQKFYIFICYIYKITIKT